MKILITGTFCSGKTTLATDLSRILPEYSLVPEPARELALGIPNIDWSLNEVRNYLIVRQVLIENTALLSSKKIIVDAGVESNLAHDELISGVKQTTILKHLNHSKYDLVFFCNHQEVSLVDDGIRMTDNKLRELLAKRIEQILIDENYKIVFISGNPSERVEFCLYYLNEFVSNKMSMIADLVGCVN